MQKQYGIEKYEDLEAFGVLAEYVRESKDENLKQLFKKLKQPRVEAAKEAARLAKRVRLERLIDHRYDFLEGKKSYTLILKSMFKVLIFYIFNFRNNVIEYPSAGTDSDSPSSGSGSLTMGSTSSQTVGETLPRSLTVGKYMSKWNIVTWCTFVLNLLLY